MDMPQTFSEAILKPNAAESARISSVNLTHFSKTSNIFYLIENISIIFTACVSLLKSSGFFTFCYGLQGFKRSFNAG